MQPLVALDAMRAGSSSPSGHRHRRCWDSRECNDGQAGVPRQCALELSNLRGTLLTRIPSTTPVLPQAPGYLPYWMLFVS